MDKKLILTFVVILAITAGIGVAVFVTAWTNPSGNPPTGSGSGFSSVPQGGILYFATSTCPTGWSEVTAARGRYVVGLPSGGSVSSTAGTALSNSENRAVGQHTHTASDSGHSHDIGVKYGVGNGYEIVQGVDPGGGAGLRSTQSATTGITVNASGTTAGTNAPYIQFLVCQKD